MVGYWAISPYHYVYDAVGNRLNETTAKGETAYTYDPANRLTSVNGQAVQWDDNGHEAPLSPRTWPPKRGNMLADGLSGINSDPTNLLS
jgi:YD repeat-containing protein